MNYLVKRPSHSAKQEIIITIVYHSLDVCTLFYHQAEVRILIPSLQVLSNYEYSGYFTSSDGEMNCTFVDLVVVLQAELGAGYDAKLQVLELEVRSYETLMQSCRSSSWR